MVQTLQGHFQEGRFVSSQNVAIPEYVEVVIVVTGNPMPVIQPPVKSSLLGCWEGLVEIPDDFDEPLEEMKEYMY